MVVRKNDLAGQRFSRLIVVSDGGRDKKKNILWLCVCDCGGRALAHAYDLRAGKIKSCGCLGREGKPRTHGLTHTPIYNVWATMVQRCTNPKERAWGRYGGRGITADAKWLTFEGFYADMGASYKPGLTLDRIDNDGGYTASNCVWRTYSEQSRNKSSTVLIEIDGAMYVQVDAAKLLGVSCASIITWRKKGMTDAQIVERARWLARKKAL